MGVGFVDFMRSELGPNWAICRATPKNLSRYGACISAKRYASLRDQWKRSNPARAAAEGIWG